MTSGSRCSTVNSVTAMYMAMVIISPWAKLTTRTTPKITDRPNAIRPYTRPVSTPPTATLRTISAGTGVSWTRARILAAFVVGLQRPFDLRVCRNFRRNRHQFAATILNRGKLQLVVLAFFVELNSGARASIVDDV